MIRLRMVALAGVGALALLLLFADLQTAYTSEHVNSQQTVSTATGTPGAAGSKLTVYLSGDLSLASAIRAQFAGAVRAKELAFADIRFVQDLPQETGDNPFLAIHIDEDRALWTPIVAKRHVTATMLFTQGRPIDRKAILAPDAAGMSVAMTADSCTGECSEGRRQITVDTNVTGLVSLPHMRAHAGGKVAQEAVQLLVDGLPASAVPSRWMSRATKLADAARGEQRGGQFSTFARLEGCRGGVLMTGGLDPGATWALIYYDASGDALTDTVGTADVQARVPGFAPDSTHGFGATSDGRRLHVGAYTVTIPAGTCGLSGWQASTH